MDPDANKISSVRFLELVVAGKIDEAYEKYVDMGGKHHHPFCPAGLPALRAAMKENDSQFPEKNITIKNAVAEDDLVAVHGRLVLRPHATEMIVVHVHRFSDSGKIVELWDCGQMLDTETKNADGAF